MASPYAFAAHPSVRYDLREIYLLIADYSGAASARRTMTAIDKTMRDLARFPHVGSRRDEIYPGLRAIPATPKAVVCFIVDDEARTVEILTVSYAGRDWIAMARRRTSHGH